MKNIDQMERCARLGSAYDPYPLDPAPPEPPRDHGRVERRLAVAFAFVAVAIFGFILGRSI